MKKVVTSVVGGKVAVKDIQHSRVPKDNRTRAGYNYLDMSMLCYLEFMILEEE